MPIEVYDPFKPLKDDVQRAMREKKTFTIKGCFPEIRRGLLRRNWIEKFHPSVKDKLSDDIKKYYSYTIPDLLNLLRDKEIAESCKKLIKSKLLLEHQVDLFWSANYDVYKEVSDIKKLTKINKLRRGEHSFTSKQGK